jgi:DNA-binding NarL/FixJ family response regulator
MFFIYTSSSLAFHSIKNSLLGKYKKSLINSAHTLEALNLKNGIIIIDDNELSHKNVLDFLAHADLSRVLVFINELRGKDIIKIANLGIKHMLSYRSIEKNLLEAIVELKKNQSYFSEDIKVILLKSLGQDHLTSYHLTNKEKEIISLLGQGFSSVEVGAALNISHLTVNVHRSNIKRKLSISNNSHFIKYCSDTHIH